MYERYHIRLQEGRTTISVDKILSDLLAVKLGYRPDEPEARRAVREWLQASFEERLSSGREGVSQAMRRYLIRELVEKEVSEGYWAWRLEKEGGRYVRRHPPI